MRKLIVTFTIGLLATFVSRAQKKDDFNIPENLGKGGLTILVASASSDKVTKEILEAFEEYYKGRYEAVSTQYPKSSNYKTEKYICCLRKIKSCANDREGPLSGHY